MLHESADCPVLNPSTFLCFLLMFLQVDINMLLVDHVVLMVPLSSGGCCGSDIKTYVVGGWSWAWWLISDTQRWQPSINIRAVYVFLWNGAGLLVAPWNVFFFFHQARLTTDKWIILLNAFLWEWLRFLNRPQLKWTSAVLNFHGGK